MANLALASSYSIRNRTGTLSGIVRRQMMLCSRSFGSTNPVASSLEPPSGACTEAGYTVVIFPSWRKNGDSPAPTHVANLERTSVSISAFISRASAMIFPRSSWPPLAASAV